jgi:hypothetical protein
VSDQPSESSLISPNWYSASVAPLAICATFRVDFPCCIRAQTEKKMPTNLDGSKIDVDVSYCRIGSKGRCIIGSSLVRLQHVFRRPTLKYWFNRALYEQDDAVIAFDVEPVQDPMG